MSKHAHLQLTFRISSMKWQSQEASGTTQTRSNSPITSLNPLRHAACMDNADVHGQCRCQQDPVNSPPEDWRRPRGRSWASYGRMWDPTISHCLKQWIWTKTGLCGGYGRRMVLCNLELHARNGNDTILYTCMLILPDTKVSDFISQDGQ